jgi:hypothetical protein
MPSAGSAEDQLTALEKRVRDLEEAIKLMTNELRHGRELEALERENLFLRTMNVMQSAGIALPEEEPRDRKKAK